MALARILLTTAISIAVASIASHVVTRSIGGFITRSIASGEVGPALVAYSPDGTRVLTLRRGEVCEWSARDGALESCFAVAGDDVRFSPDGARLVVRAWDSDVRVVDAITGAVVFALADTSGAREASFSPDGTRIFVRRARRDPSTLFDAATGARVADVALPHGVFAFAFAPRAPVLLVADRAGTVSLREIRDGQERYTLREALSTWDVGFADGSAFFVVGTGDSGAGVVHIRDTASGALRSVISEPAVRPRLPPPAAPPLAVSLAPDSAQLLVGRWTRGEERAFVYDATTGAARFSLARGPHGSTAQFSAHGARILTASVTRADVWDAVTGARTATIPAREDAGAFAGALFSPDATRIVTVSERWPVRVWSTDGTLLFELSPGAP